MASHTIRYLELLGLPWEQWSRRSPRPVEEKLAASDVILVLISDGAIVSFLHDHLTLSRRPLVHFSGSISTTMALGMHPLCTFGDDLYDLETYRAIPFVCEAGSQGFREIFPAFPNPHYTIDAAQKPLYHALAVMAGNFSAHLWNKLFTTFENQFGLPRQVAIPYLQQVCRNLTSNPTSALTGPLSREDGETIKANLAALRGDPYEEIYRAFISVIAPELVVEP